MICAGIALAVVSAPIRTKGSIIQPSCRHICLSCGSAELRRSGLYCNVHRDKVSLTDYCQFFTVWRYSIIKEELH